MRILSCQSAAGCNRSGFATNGQTGRGCSAKAAHPLRAGGRRCRHRPPKDQGTRTLRVQQPYPEPFGRRLPAGQRMIDDMVETATLQRSRSAYADSRPPASSRYTCTMPSSSSGSDRCFASTSASSASRARNRKRNNHPPQAAESRHWGTGRESPPLRRTRASAASRPPDSAQYREHRAAAGNGAQAAPASFPAARPASIRAVATPGSRDTSARCRPRCGLSPCAVALAGARILVGEESSQHRQHRLLLRRRGIRRDDGGKVNLVIGHARRSRRPSRFRYRTVA